MINAQKKNATSSVGRNAGGTKTQQKHISLDFNRQVFEGERAEDWRIEKIKRVMRKVIPYSYGLSVALNLALIMTPEWMTRRGYFAIGGEWLLIGVAGYAASKAIKRFCGGKK